MTNIIKSTLQYIVPIALATTACYFGIKYFVSMQDTKNAKKAAKMAESIELGQTIEFTCTRTDRKRTGYIVSLNISKQYCTVRVTNTHRLESVDFFNIDKIIEP